MFSAGAKVKCNVKKEDGELVTICESATATSNESKEHAYSIAYKEAKNLVKKQAYKLKGKIDKQEKEEKQGKEEKCSHTKKTILITGAGSGIGRGVAFKLSKMNKYRVIACVKTYRAIETLQRMANAAHVEIYKIIKLDITNQEDINNAVKKYTIHILLNNAGGFHSFPSISVPIEDAEYHNNTNYLGGLRMTQAFAQKMVTHNIKGHIYFMSSIAGIVGFYTAGAYCGSKSAVEGMAQTMYNEFKSLGINVSAFVPDLYNTGFDIGATDYFLQNYNPKTSFTNFKTFMEYRDLYTKNPQPVYKIVDFIVKSINSGTTKYRLITPETEQLIRPLQQDVWDWN